MRGCRRDIVDFEPWKREGGRKKGDNHVAV